jgi:hypothetical protein
MRSGLIAMVLLVQAGCGGGASGDAGSAGTDVTAPAVAAAGAEAVDAVLQKSGTPVARLQFVIDSRPVVGQSFTVRLLATASEAVPALQLVSESAELKLENPSTLLVLESSDTGATHALTAIAGQEGLAEIIVKLRGDPARPEAVYSIPVMVGPPAAG